MLRSGYLETTGKKLSSLLDRRRTARRDISVKSLLTVAKFVKCRNNLYDKSRTNGSDGVRGLQLTNVQCASNRDALDRRIGLLDR